MADLPKGVLGPGAGRSFTAEAADRRAAVLGRSDELARLAGGAASPLAAQVAVADLLAHPPTASRSRTWPTPSTSWRPSRGRTPPPTWTGSATPSAAGSKTRYRSLRRRGCRPAHPPSARPAA